MHKILFLLFVWSWTASIVGAVEIDECKTDVYFGNGILTSREAAIFNTDEILEPAIIEKFGIDYYNKNIDEVSYAYNTTNGFFSDNLESLLQKIGWLHSFPLSKWECIQTKPKVKLT